MNYVFIGGGVVVLLMMLILWARSASSKTAPAETPTGGTTVANSPALTKPTAGTTANISAANTPVTQTPAGPKETAKIVITKDTSSLSSDPGNNGGEWRTFQVAEVFAYSNGKKLSASDYSDARLSSTLNNGNEYPASYAIDNDSTTFSHTGNYAIGSLTLTLKKPTVITRVEVLNRQDCCQGRLEGARLSLIDINNLVFWSGTLTGLGGLQIYTM